MNYKELRGAKKVPEKILTRSIRNGFNGSKRSKQNLAKDRKFATKAIGRGKSLFIMRSVIGSYTSYIEKVESAMIMKKICHYIWVKNYVIYHHRYLNENEVVLSNSHFWQVFPYSHSQGKAIAMKVQNHFSALLSNYRTQNKSFDFDYDDVFKAHARFSEVTQLTKTHFSRSWSVLKYNISFYSKQKP